MMPSRLAAACATVSRAMGGRDAGRLGEHAAGQPLRALGAAARMSDEQVDRARGVLLEEASVERLDPSWFVDPLGRMPPRMRSATLALLPPPVGRYAALAWCRATGEDLPRPPGTDARPFLARLLAGLVLRPPLGLPLPPWLAGADPPDPVRWAVAHAGSLPAADLAARWPDEWEACETMIARRLPPGTPPSAASPLGALAATLAARADEAGAAAALMPHRTGRGFLCARERWLLLLDPADAEELARSLENAEVTP